MNNFREHFVFENPWWLLALVLLPPLFFIRNRMGSESSLDFPSISILSSVGTKPKERFGSIVFLFFTVALFLGILGLARPQWRDSYVARNASGIDIIIALDVSNSMQIKDYQKRDDQALYRVRRLDAAKEVIEEFVSQRPNDRIGLIGFGMRPYSVSPITLDHDWLLTSLRDLRVGDIDDNGTAVGSAIAASATRLTDRQAKSKIVVIVTDGASNSGPLKPLQAAGLAAQLGIRVYTVAIGSKEGRLQKAPNKAEFDPETLQTISELTKGEFYLATSTADLRDSFSTINDLEKTESTSRVIVNSRELYVYFIGAALLCTFLALSHLAMNPPPVP